MSDPSREPPREALKQQDGSYILRLDDGSTKRWTRRPDGTWRKPEHVRAGYVGDLEQKKYTAPGTASPAVQTSSGYGGAPRGAVPGAAPGAFKAPVEVDAGVAKTKAQKDNERKKEKRKEANEAKEAERLTRPIGESVVVEDAKKPPAKAAAAAVVPDTWDGAEASAAPAAVDAEKKKKAIEKKLRQIADLEARQAQGEALNEDQLGKIGQKLELEAQLEDAIAGRAPVAVPVASAAPAQIVTAAVARDVAAPLRTRDEQGGPSHARDPQTSAATPAPATAAEAIPEPPKNTKAIEKKLRQITEIEQKRKNGESLNSEQLAKLAQKKQLEEELAQATGW